MSGEELLEELDARAYEPPEAERKHDPRPSYDAMASWVATLSPGQRSQLFAALPRWLEKRVDRWYPWAALEVAVRVGATEVIDSGVAEARKRGVHDGDYSMDPDWYDFHLALCATAVRLPTADAIAYLRELRDQVPLAESYLRRSLALGAWIALCWIEDDNADECLAGAIGWLRGWNDDGLKTELLAFIDGRWGEERLRELVTPEEFALVVTE